MWLKKLFPVLSDLQISRLAAVRERRMFLAPLCYGTHRPPGRIPHLVPRDGQVIDPQRQGIGTGPEFESSVNPEASDSAAVTAGGAGDRVLRGFWA
jgi:hypothetical protein